MRGFEGGNAPSRFFFRLVDGWKPPWWIVGSLPCPLETHECNYQDHKQGPPVYTLPVRYIWPLWSGHNAGSVVTSESGDTWKWLLDRPEDIMLPKIICILTKSEYYAFVNTKQTHNIIERLEKASFRLLESHSSSACVVSLYRQSQQHDIVLGTSLALRDVSPSRLPPPFYSHILTSEKFRAE